MPCRPERQDHGRYLNILSGRKTFVQRELRRHGLAGYEAASIAAILASCATVERVSFLDIGAHLGLYAMLVAKLFPHDGTRIVAFEPHPETAGLGRRLAALNGLRFTIEECAVSDGEEPVELFISSKAETSNSLDPNFRNSAKSVRVPCTTIDAYCYHHDLSPSVMKIDVENLEHLVLAAGLQTIAAARPYIVCEVLGKRQWRRLGAVFGQLEALGYSIYKLNSRDGLIETDFKSGRKLIADNRHNRDWLFAPATLDTRWKTEFAKWRTALGHCGKAANVNGFGAGAARYLASVKCSDPLPSALRLKLTLLREMLKG